MISALPKTAKKDTRKLQFFYHFLPHPEKQRRAGLLANKSIVIYCFIIFLIISAIRFLPRIAPGVLGYASNIATKDLLTYTNLRRKDANQPPLRLNKELTAAAKLKAEHMFAHNYWAHISPEGVEPWGFILDQKYDYTYAGENLAKNFSTSHDVVDAWYTSPSHRENLLSPNYDEMGFAVVNGVLDGYQTTLVVQMFGRPRDKSLLATAQEEQAILADAQSPIAQAPISATTLVVNSHAKRGLPAVLPSIDIPSASKKISLSIALFVVTLLGLDLWYTNKKSIAKVNGHTLAHLSVLLIVMASIWLFLRPGIIL